MSNVSINLNIDRLSSGNSRIHGKIGNQTQDVVVRKGPQEGDAYIEGEQSGAPTTLRINGAFSQQGQAIFGRLAGVEFRGNWQQEPTEGDVYMSLNKANLTIDQSPDARVTECHGTRVKSTTTVTNSEGDESLVLLADGQRLTMAVDRQPDGSIDIEGKSGASNYRLSMERHGKDGALRVKGTIPESLSLLPVMWELYGDDSKEPPAKPLSMGAAATLSAFWGLMIEH